MFPHSGRGVVVGWEPLTVGRVIFTLGGAENSSPVEPKHEHHEIPTEQPPASPPPLQTAAISFLLSRFSLNFMSLTCRLSQALGGTQ